MKILHISEEIEKILITVFDAALKAGGFQLHAGIQKVISEIQVPVEAPKE